jgi:hypothetical protein
MQINVRSPSGKFLVTKVLRAIKLWTQVSKIECKYIQLLFTILDQRMAYVKGPLNGHLRWKQWRGSQEAKVCVAISPKLLKQNSSLTPHVSTAFLSVEGSYVVKLVSRLVRRC